MHVNLIGKSNGVGLDRDARLLADALRAAGCEVTQTITGSRQSGRRKSLLFNGLRAFKRLLLPKPVPRFDLNVMLEHVWTQYAQQARANVVVPNPDFFDRHDVAALPTVDWVWAKTRVAEQLFTSLGARVQHIGFDSEDRFLTEAPRRRIALHLAGSSLLKGTAPLLKLWVAHPHWPELHVVGRLKVPVPTAANIHVHAGFMPDDELKRLQNEALIHVCTSEAEGWGHYLVEAMSVGAVVITVDAPPMNELVTPERGWLLSCHANGNHRLARRHLFDEASLCDVMEIIMTEDMNKLRALGNCARQWFLQNHRTFHERVKQSMTQVSASLE